MANSSNFFLKSGSACASQTTVSPRYRKALWAALIINVVMFAVEIVGGLKSGSVSLFADAAKLRTCNACIQAASSA